MAHVVEQRAGVGLLGSDGEEAAIGRDRQIEAVDGAGGEAGSGAWLPLHGGAATGTVGGSLDIGGVGLVAHAYLVAIVDKGYAGHGEQEGHGHAQLVGGIAAAGTEALEVVVGGGQTDVATGAGEAVALGEIVDELVDAPTAVAVEVTVLKGRTAAGRGVAVEEERGVTGAVEVHEEVDVEASGDGHGGVGPLGDEGAMGVVAVAPLPHLLPQLADGRAVGVVLDERRRHVDTEPVDALVKPERHDVAQLAAHSLRACSQGREGSGWA